MPNVIPDVGQAAHARLLIDAIKESVADLRSDVKDIKDHRHSDFRWYISIFGGGFLVLAGLSLVLYSRMDDRVQALSTTLTRVETKLEMLLQRLPAEPPKK